MDNKTSKRVAAWAALLSFLFVQGPATAFALSPTGTEQQERRPEITIEEAAMRISSDAAVPSAETGFEDGALSAVSSVSSGASTQTGHSTSVSTSTSTSASNSTQTNVGTDAALSTQIAAEAVYEDVSTDAQGNQITVRQYETHQAVQVKNAQGILTEHLIVRDLGEAGQEIRDLIRGTVTVTKYDREQAVVQAFFQIIGRQITKEEKDYFVGLLKRTNMDQVRISLKRAAESIRLLREELGLTREEVNAIRIVRSERQTMGGCNIWGGNCKMLISFHSVILQLYQNQFEFRGAYRGSKMAMSPASLAVAQVINLIRKVTGASLKDIKAEYLHYTLNYRFPGYMLQARTADGHVFTFSVDSSYKSVVLTKHTQTWQDSDSTAIIYFDVRTHQPIRMTVQIGQRSVTLNLSTFKPASRGKYDLRMTHGVLVHFLQRHSEVTSETFDLVRYTQAVKPSDQGSLSYHELTMVSASGISVIYTVHKTVSPDGVKYAVTQVREKTADGIVLIQYSADRTVSSYFTIQNGTAILTTVKIETQDGRALKAVIPISFKLTEGNLSAMRVMVEDLLKRGASAGLSSVDTVTLTRFEHVVYPYIRDPRYGIDLVAQFVSQRFVYSYDLDLTARGEYKIRNFSMKPRWWRGRF